MALSLRWNLWTVSLITAPTSGDRERLQSIQRRLGMLESVKRSGATLTLALGVLGGMLLVAFGALAGTGIVLLIPYALLVGGVGVIIRAEHIVAFWARFGIVLGAFVISSVVLYVALVLSPATPPLSLLEHGWRLGAILLIGIVVSLPLARVTGHPGAAPASAS